MTFSGKYLDYLELQAPIHVYGATQPNVKCKNKKQKQKTDTQPAIQDRTLRGMRRDYRRFLKGGENKKKAAACKNVINYLLFKVPLCHVCPLYFHIVLGIVKKYHDMLENECHKLETQQHTWHRPTSLLTKTLTSESMSPNLGGKR